MPLKLGHVSLPGKSEIIMEKIMECEIMMRTSVLNVSWNFTNSEQRDMSIDKLLRHLRNPANTVLSLS